jgi:hypothetical protein
MFRPHRVSIWLTFRIYKNKYTFIHIVICMLIFICSVSLPDADPIGSKHVVVSILYKVVFECYLLTTSFIVQYSGMHNFNEDCTYF